MKWLIRIGVPVILLLLVIGIGLFFYLDAIVKSAIEQSATSATGVETTVGTVSVGVFGGELAMTGLEMANPPGFKGDEFLTLGSGDVAVSLGTLMDKTIVLPHLKLDNLYVNLDAKDDGTANYKVIMDNLEGQGKDKQPAPETTDSKGYVVKLIQITNINVDANYNGQTVKLNIPEIRLTDVGSDTSGGVLLSQLQGVIVEAVFRAILENGAQVLPGLLAQGLGDGLEGIGDIADFGSQTVGDVSTAAGGLISAIPGGEGAGKAVGDVGKQVTDAIGQGAQDAGKDADKVVNEIGQGLGNLFGGNQGDNSQDDASDK